MRLPIFAAVLMLPLAAGAADLEQAIGAACIAQGEAGADEASLARNCACLARVGAPLARPDYAAAVMAGEPYSGPYPFEPETVFLYEIRTNCPGLVELYDGSE